MYATLTDMRSRIETRELIQLTDEAGNGIINDVAIAAALADTDNLIDSYLAVQYGLPLTTVPAALIPVAVDIARYKLWKNTPPDYIKAKYDEAIKWLQSLAAGKAKLDVAGAELPPPADTIIVSDNIVAGARDRMRGF